MLVELQILFVLGPFISNLVAIVKFKFLRFQKSHQVDAHFYFKGPF